MSRLLKQITVGTLCCALTVLAWPLRARGEGALRPGSESADEAAAPSFRGAGSSYLLGAYAFADTTGYDFPEEEEKTTGQVIKEIAIWGAAAALVAFFIAVVFLSGDDDPPPDDGNSKPPPPPPGALNVPLPSWVP